MDITDIDMTESVLTKFGPDTVILASGMTSVEQCESYPQRAWSMNVDGTMNVAITCNKIGARLMYISPMRSSTGRKARNIMSSTPQIRSPYMQRPS